MPDHAAWLDQVHEEVIEPERRICDPHHHLWDRNGNRYLLDELLADTGSGHNVVSTVFVECLSMYRAGGPEELRPVGETEFVQGVAAMSASGGYGPMRACSAIIGRATLSMGAAAGAVLDAHIAASPNRFRGIRDAAGWDPSPDVRNSHTNPPEHLFLDAQFREGMKELERRGLVFEAWHYHTQIPELTSLARAFPGVTVVLDHFGGPLGIGPYEGRADEVFEDWRRNIDDLATCPNVVAKLGGINMPINGFGWHKRAVPPTSDELVAATRRYYEHTIDRFGPGRCMFESNFPVDRESCSYRVLWNAFKKLAAGHPEDEKDAMFYGTATRVYRIEEEG
ncbi:MAG TPA: amidohydrolase family protein [Tepidiformaceae bacterium]|nr:amidohydrolase family protein [Tepidiformaceae bacterium]